MTSLRRSGFNRITRGRPDQEAVRAMAIVVVPEKPPIPLELRSKSPF